MPRKQTTKPAAQVKPPDYLGHTCGDCGRGVFSYEFSNLDLKGKPICLSCPHHKWMKIRSTKACDKWKPKKQEK